jgi:hypothetical protein
LTPDELRSPEQARGNPGATPAAPNPAVFRVLRGLQRNPRGSRCCLHCRATAAAYRIPMAGAEGMSRADVIRLARESTRSPRHSQRARNPPHPRRRKMNPCDQRGAGLAPTLAPRWQPSAPCGSRRYSSRVIGVADVGERGHGTEPIPTDGNGSSREDIPSAACIALVHPYSHELTSADPTAFSRLSITAAP